MTGIKDHEKTKEYYDLCKELFNLGSIKYDTLRRCFTCTTTKGVIWSDIHELIVLGHAVKVLSEQDRAAVLQYQDALDKENPEYDWRLISGSSNRAVTMMYLKALQLSNSASSYDHFLEVVKNNTELPFLGT